MVGESTKAENERVDDQWEREAVLTWATVFEKDEWSTGPVEIVSTLINISECAKNVTGEVAEALRLAIQESKVQDDPEIMEDVKDVRKAWPRDHWWWYLEEI